MRVSTRVEMHSARPARQQGLPIWDGRRFGGAGAGRRSIGAGGTQASFQDMGAAADLTRDWPSWKPDPHDLHLAQTTTLAGRPVEVGAQNSGASLASNGQLKQGRRAGDAGVASAAAFRLR